MITDHIDNAHCYPLDARFEKAFKFLRRDDLDSLPVGRYDIEGDTIFALVQHYDTRPPLPRWVEAHQKYIDVQFMVSGNERIALAPLHGLVVTEPYNEAKDITFYSADAVTEFALNARHFMVIFLHEAHQPYSHPLPAATPVAVKKVVVKIRAEGN